MHPVVDIGCGMVATETDIPAERFADMSFRRAFQEKLKERIPVGEGVSHRETQNWEGFEECTVEKGARKAQAFGVNDMAPPRVQKYPLPLATAYVV